jgi:conjugal transfer pilus assembly protein TraW
MAPFLNLFLRFVTVTILASDFGTHGHTFEIQEESLVDYLERKLEGFNEEKLGKLNEKLRTHYKKKLCHPAPVETIRNAKTHSIHYFDPTIVAKQEIKDDEGKVIIEKGTIYNPLKYFVLNEELLFFDGSNISQLEWAKKQGTQAKWILTSGNPLELEDREERPIYFDQNGLLTQKLKINFVPARVSQEDNRLKIEIIPIEEQTCER